MIWFCLIFAVLCGVISYVEALAFRRFIKEDDLFNNLKNFKRKYRFWGFWL